MLLTNLAVLACLSTSDKSVQNKVFFSLAKQGELEVYHSD